MKTFKFVHVVIVQKGHMQNAYNSNLGLWCTDAVSCNVIRFAVFRFEGGKFVFLCL